MVQDELLLLARWPLAVVGARAGPESRPQVPTVVLCGVQDRGGEVRHLLPALDGTHPAEGREAGQAVPDGDPVHPSEEPLSSLPAIQRACALPQQHLPGRSASNGKISKCLRARTLSIEGSVHHWVVIFLFTQSCTLLWLLLFWLPTGGEFRCLDHSG